LNYWCERAGYLDDIATNCSQQRLFLIHCFLSPEDFLMAKKRTSAAKKKNGRRKRQSWTTEHLKALRLHSRSKTAVKEISKLLKRTPGALRQKALELGLPLGHRR
jgi:hypothetical protein